MKNFYRNVINTFDHKIEKLSAERYSLNILNDPDRDFTRNRKLDFPDIVNSIVYMAGKPIREELYDYFDYDPETVSASAFVQQRDKLRPEAFELLLKRMNKAYPCEKKLKNYYLIAVDGSDLCIPYDRDDAETYVPNAENVKGSNHLHINAAYDILNHRYVDTVIRGASHYGEQYSMYTMAECFPEKAIFIADRNYSTWNNMEHIIKAGQKFLVRVQDIHSSTSNLRKFSLPDSEFDMDVHTILTTKMTNEIRKHPEKYRFLSNSSTFDFIDKLNPFYPVHYRAVRFRIDGKEEYESVITNLDRDEFPPDLIKNYTACDGTSRYPSAISNILQTYVLFTAERETA